MDLAVHPYAADHHIEMADPQEEVDLLHTEKADHLLIVAEEVDHLHTEEVDHLLIVEEADHLLIDILEALLQEAGIPQDDLLLMEEADLPIEVVLHMEEVELPLGIEEDIEEVEVVEDTDHLLDIEDHQLGEEEEMIFHLNHAMF